LDIASQQFFSLFLIDPSIKPIFLLVQNYMAIADCCGWWFPASAGVPVLANDVPRKMFLSRNTQPATLDWSVPVMCKNRLVEN
jgi:hypothetical protein